MTVIRFQDKLIFITLKYLSLVLIFELLLAGSVLGFSSKPAVLGLSLIAQNVGQADQATPTDQPVTPVEAPTETPVEVSPVEMTPEPNVFMMTPIETSAESPHPGETIAMPTVEESMAPSETPIPEATPGVPAIISSTEEGAINEGSLAEVADEEKALSLTVSPEDQVILLTGFAQDKVNDINKFLLKNDQASVNFAAQRLNDQLTDALDNLDKVNSQNRTKIEIQVDSLCSNIENSLRPDQLAVSESNEADLEVLRGKCLGVKL